MKDSVYLCLSLVEKPSLKTCATIGLDGIENPSAHDLRFTLGGGSHDLRFTWVGGSHDLRFTFGGAVHDFRFTETGQPGPDPGHVLRGDGLPSLEPV